MSTIPQLQELALEKIHIYGKERFSNFFDRCIERLENASTAEGIQGISLFPLLVPKEITQPVFNFNNSLIEAINLFEEFLLSPENLEYFNLQMSTLYPIGQRFVCQSIKEPNFSMQRRSRRIDGFLNEEGLFKAIEVNQAAPHGYFTQDTCQKIVSEMLNEIGFNYHPIFKIPQIYQWIIDEYQFRNPGQLPSNVAVVIEHGFSEKCIDLTHTARELEKLSTTVSGEKINFHVCYPYELSLIQKRAHLRNLPIDLIWRNSVYMFKYKVQKKDYSNYTQICSDPENNIVINSTRTWLTKSKDTLSFLSDFENHKILNLSQPMSTDLLKILPKTLGVHSKKSDIDVLLSEKNSWICKPSDSSHGARVFFGVNHTYLDWKEIVNKRLGKRFVFQEYIQYPTVEKVNFFADRTFKKQKMQFDFCPHHINGKCLGTALIRGSFQFNEMVKPMNMSSGAKVVPFVAI